MEFMLQVPLASMRRRRRLPGATHPGLDICLANIFGNLAPPWLGVLLALLSRQQSADLIGCAITGGLSPYHSHGGWDRILLPDSRYFFALSQ
jgi:hypothetical protein